jgi:hypothetical protein
MPKPNFILTDFQKNELYKKLCTKIGFPIRTKLDCRKLSELIEKEGLQSISESTIYRMFLLKGNSNQPYLHTLNIFARFCGFEDWNNFEKAQMEAEQFLFGFGKFHQKQPNFKSLITVCIHTQELKPLSFFTEQFEGEVQQYYKEKFAEEIFQAVLSNTNNEMFFKKFHHFPVIREYFFELLADPTFSIPGYEVGINYYLKGLQHETSTKDLQDVIFGNCLLFRHYFITKQHEKAAQIGRFLFDELQLTTAQLETIHMFPIARYFSCKLLYLEMQQEVSKAYEFFESIVDDISSKMDKLSVEEQRILFYSFGEALVMSSSFTSWHHQQWKDLFAHLFQQFPNHLFHQKLDKIVPYFNKNSSVYLFA